MVTVIKFNMPKNKWVASCKKAPNGLSRRTKKGTPNFLDFFSRVIYQKKDDSGH